ncbi:hypothetical protein [Arenimonas caeni]|jgi:hypothetical protein|uniref:hypothetical protein n=1 Tax=Arenimonas caeni TaxID=2058085 RepID=UPI002A36EBBA|nr:hypothetical protein [Arenimonas caeni]MDY0021636.1 hypothetical protein [Arenimonas caeni]
MNTIRRQLLVLGACLGLAACASIPLGTLWKLRGFDEQTLERLEPTDLRAAVALKPEADVLPDSVRLALELQRRDGPPERHAFGLEPGTGPGPLDRRLRYSVWQLDQAGLKALASVQRTMRAARAADEDAYTGATFSVNFRPDLGDAPPAALQVSVQLMLAPEDGWMLLIDEANIPVSR